MRSKLYLLLITSSILIPMESSAQALNIENTYLGVAGEWNVLNDEKVRNVDNYKAKFKDGWGAFLTGGMQFDDHYRTELELGYRDNKVKTVIGAPVSGSGHNRTWTLMANGLYDFTNSTKITPYLGIGVGVADVKYSDVNVSSTTIFDSSSVRPAIQGIAGVSYKVADNMDVFVNYQYLTTSRYKIESESGSGVATDQYRTNEFLLGLKYKFGGPKKQTITYEKSTTVKPEPSRDTYLVFFDWDKDNLTNEASQIIDVAAQSALKKKEITLYVTGHTDTSGSAQYNMKLSKRRALNVKNAMIKKGIPADDIVVYAKGESEPLVATGDNVREPQNRRVEIVYSAH